MFLILIAFLKSYEDFFNSLRECDKKFRKKLGIYLIHFIPSLKRFNLFLAPKFSFVCAFSEPARVPAPLPISATEDMLQVNLKVFRVSERLGKIRQHYLVISPYHLLDQPLDTVTVDDVSCTYISSILSPFFLSSSFLVVSFVIWPSFK